MMNNTLQNEKEALFVRNKIKKKEKKKKKTSFFRKNKNNIDL